MFAESFERQKLVNDFESVKLTLVLNTICFLSPAFIVIDETGF